LHIHDIEILHNIEGGAMVGAITGALKGQTTETGFVRGAGVGALTGAITALQLMEQILNGDPFSKVAMICSLIEGKIFMEWVSPAVLKAYQCPMADELIIDLWESNIFGDSSSMGLSLDMINNLPMFKIHPNGTTNSDLHELSCPICYQDMEKGECARKLANCMHYFHKHCIDQWLTRNASCPICRQDVLVCTFVPPID
ncbi:hypothetical protein Leryth_005923, partial [Lithospermum erythrorhizon]